MRGNVIQRNRKYITNKEPIIAELFNKMIFQLRLENNHRKKEIKKDHTIINGSAKSLKSPPL
jgi:hypothetical protein